MKKKFVILVSLLVLVLGVGFFVNLKFNEEKEAQINISPQSLLNAPAFSPPATNLTSPSVQETALPESYLIQNFPFQSQAPFGLWDELHDEACEEAAVILVNYYLSDKSLDASGMEDNIQKMVAWEIEKFGSHKDLTIQEVAETAGGFYGMNNFRIKDDITIEDIKKEVAQNHPVIIPTAGRLLGNPYFRSPGPIYHMLVVIGYRGKTIIVQDIGTKRGDHYEYNETILFNAIHDWNQSPENIENGAKRMLVIEN